MVQFHSRQVATLEKNFPHGSLPEFLEFYILLKKVCDLIQKFDVRAILCFCIISEENELAQTINLCS